MSDAHILVELANLAASRHDERRKYEWKVSFAFWALIVGAILRKPDFTIHIPLIIGFLVFFLYSFLWIRGIWVANENDKRLLYFFRDQAVRALNNPGAPIPVMPSRITCRSGTYWFGFCQHRFRIRQKRRFRFDTFHGVVGPPFWVLRGEGVRPAVRCCRSL